MKLAIVKTVMFGAALLNTQREIDVFAVDIPLPYIYPAKFVKHTPLPFESLGVASESHTPPIYKRVFLFDHDLLKPHLPFKVPGIVFEWCTPPI